MNELCEDCSKKLNEFPSPTGVNYYEFADTHTYVEIIKNEFPSPTGVNYYEWGLPFLFTSIIILFPSPTGVNYYEW